MNDDFKKIKYNHYVSEYSKFVTAVREICPTPSDCERLVSDDDIINFMYAFKALGQSLEAVKRHPLFNWNDLNGFMSEYEFLEYKAWYFTFYDEMKEKGEMDETLKDLDIEPKIVRSFKVDKAYLISMLENFCSFGEEDREKDIELIKRELDITDNEQMRHKAPVMKEFINLRFSDLNPNADVEEEYEKFEKETFEKSIADFSKNHNLDSEFVRSILNEYFTDKQSINQIVLHKRLADKNLPLIEQTVTINDFMAFIRDMYEKFK